MSAKVAALLPVLDRPERAKWVYDSLTASTEVTSVEPVFIVSPDDPNEERAIRALGLDPIKVNWEPGQGDYPRKINYAVRRLRKDFDFFLFGADDLIFHPGWIEYALAKWQESYACVIGTNDGHNRRVLSGQHSTHPLVHRGYYECGTVDKRNLMLHEGYWHNYCDDEFVQTAQARETYVHCQQSRVEHFHPDWGQGTMDATYVRGKAHFNEDAALYESRKGLWGR